MTSFFKNLLANTNAGASSSATKVFSPRSQKKKQHNKALASKLDRLRRQNSQRLARAQSLLSDISVDTHDDNHSTNSSSIIPTTTTTTNNNNHNQKSLSPQEVERQDLLSEIESLQSQLIATRNDLFETKKDLEKRLEVSQTQWQERLTRVQTQAERASNTILSQELQALQTLQQQIATQVKSQEP
eukprot:CAMPEP_0117064520 /NCGR_PEP_ID=MMETSP0472-20121206/45071_1 /TAXON_ID=693140 ORGANISM="Tiarina fusus, Strain LIS" /NCGR_SAMPLE_ID=MMETSP0472 /ASSEMBLY_ACC=CAM_ASM_000603 /LENGTH=185 /DNA_ID=CAMNT_0004784713 /DNA_START=283 /DNA_END=836 /DNA_ORIENTATION=+